MNVARIAGGLCICLVLLAMTGWVVANVQFLM
jgi:hypothetical protein